MNLHRLRIAFRATSFALGVGWNFWIGYRLMPSKAVILAITIPAVLFGGAAAFAVAKKGGAFSSVPIPSDQSLITKYGLTNPKDNILNFATISLSSMRIQYAKFTPSCAGGSTPSGAMKALGVAEGFVSEVPIIGNFLGDAIGFIGSVFDHHAQAVAKEQSTLCAASGAFNAAMDAFDQALTAGQYSSSDAPGVYETLFQRIVAMSQPVAQGCPPSSATGSAANKGNEACVVRRIGQAILEKRLAQLGIVGVVS